MGAACIELTAEEKSLLKQIDFDPAGSPRHEQKYWISVGVASQKLMNSLVERKAIPPARVRYFTRADHFIGGRGVSRLNIFERNGTTGQAVFRHPHFLKHLHYFLYGPDLPAELEQMFEAEVKAHGSRAPREALELGRVARSLARSHDLDRRYAAEEFFKLALECGFGPSDARSIRDAVKR